MDNGLSGKNHILHFVCPISWMHFVYHLLSIRKQHLLPCFEHILKYIERCYRLKVWIFYKDGELIVQYFNDFKDEYGLIIENLPLYIQA
jgi:hypothetical protein